MFMVLPFLAFSISSFILSNIFFLSDKISSLVRGLSDFFSLRFLFTFSCAALSAAFCFKSLYLASQSAAAFLIASYSSWFCLILSSSKVPTPNAYFCSLRNLASESGIGTPYLPTPNPLANCDLFVSSANIASDHFLEFSFVGFFSTSFCMKTMYFANAFCSSGVRTLSPSITSCIAFSKSNPLSMSSFAPSFISSRSFGDFS